MNTPTKTTVTTTSFLKKQFITLSQKNIFLFSLNKVKCEEWRVKILLFGIALEPKLPLYFPYSNMTTTKNDNIQHLIKIEISTESSRAKLYSLILACLKTYITYIEQCIKPVYRYYKEYKKWTNRLSFLKSFFCSQTIVKFKVKGNAK